MLANMEMTEESEHYMYDFESFVSEFGGSLGLFLGFSFFTLWDFGSPILVLIKNAIKRTVWICWIIEQLKKSFSSQLQIHTYLFKGKNAKIPAKACILLSLILSEYSILTTLTFQAQHICNNLQEFITILFLSAFLTDWQVFYHGPLISFHSAIFS